MSTEKLTEQVSAAMPTSFAAGQIPRSQVLAFLAPLIAELVALRERVESLERPKK